MSKEKKSNKESKKPAMLSMKEKRANKKSKKQQAAKTVGGLNER